MQTDYDNVAQQLKKTKDELTELHNKQVSMDGS